MNEIDRACGKRVEQMIRTGKPELIHVICGPRQVGKTTAARQMIKRAAFPSIYASADSATPLGAEWIETQWYRAEREASKTKTPVLLVLDELQKIAGWSETLKKVWDSRQLDIRLLVLGSSALLLNKGLAESLAGRFFMHRFPHWTLPESMDAFGWGLDEWIFFGGYPGAAKLAENETDWKQYVSESLVETVLARDVLQMHPITKPALLRNLFGLATVFPAQIVSYNKMLGQLQEAGNTTTLAHYLKLMESAFLASGLELYSKGQQRKRGSSPKLIIWNNALVNAAGLRSFSECIHDRIWRGHLIENAVGAHLLQSLQSPHMSVTYWRKGNLEVDFVVESAGHTVALEIKSGRAGKINGLAEFKKQYPGSRCLLVGANGIPLDEFFGTDAADILCF